jgi:hypothetical protein
MRNQLTLPDCQEKWIKESGCEFPSAVQCDEARAICDDVHREEKCQPKLGTKQCCNSLGCFVITYDKLETRRMGISI